MKLKQINVPLSVKAVDKKGVFTGYGSVFGTIDGYKERVMPGAFEESLEKHKERGTMPAMLWQHDSREPIGVYTAVKEDDHGLHVEGQLAIDASVPFADKAHSLLMKGAMRGLSIGYRTIGWEDNEDEDVLELTKIDLWEISLVTFPANPDATVDAVRTRLQADEDLQPKDLELILRDAGLSRRQAKGLLSNGYDGYKLRDADGLDDLSQSLRRLNAAITA